MADLLEEAKLAVRVRHPNIVPTLDVGESGKSLFLVMDYVEGDSLSGLIRRARKAGRELAFGHDHAHSLRRAGRASRCA